MMKKILLSVAIIGAVAAIVVGATTAYFSDTETSTGNTFTAGTIDIAVDDQNPWSQSVPFVLADMKPSQVDYTNFAIKNVGTNPTNVWKKVSGVTVDENGVNEPECVAYGGTWTGGTKQNGILDIDCANYDQAMINNKIDEVITYDLSVIVKDNQNQPIWNQTLYNMNKTIAQIDAMGGNGTFLGMIPSGYSMDVTESYHMASSTENWAQSDKMTFNITVTAEQLTGVAILENKDQVAPWRVLGEDAYTGTLTYGVKDSKFNYSFAGVTPLVGTNYSLIVYAEPFSTPAGNGWPRPVIILGNAMSNGAGNVSIPSTSLELNTNLLNAKVWLVKSSDLTGNTMNTWDSSTETNSLFDTGLIDYYDADL